VDTPVLRHVKKEIRVLGVAGRRDAKGVDLIGVIYRGNMMLDGVIRAHSQNLDVSDSLVSMVNNSTHRGQLRVIIMERGDLPPDICLDAHKLATSTEKAVILLGNWGLDQFTFSDGSYSFSPFGLSRWIAESVLRASSIDSWLPEAVRVARLIMRALPDS
jgi:endonuclease V-like protein UPF0215 family